VIRLLNVNYEESPGSQIGPASAGYSIVSIVATESNPDLLPASELEEVSLPAPV